MIRIVKPKHGNSGADHVHGIRILWGRINEIDNAARQLAMRPKLAGALLQFLTIRKPIIPEQEDHFLVADFPGQLVDIVTAINQLSFVANDVTQPRRIRHHPFESACAKCHL